MQHSVNLLVVASRFPYPLEKGDKLRLYHHIRQLSQQHRITLLALHERPIPTEHLEHLQAFCTAIHLLPLSRWRIVVNLFLGFWRGLPFQVGYFYHPVLQKEIHDLIKKSNANSIYCQLIRMAPYVQDLPMVKILDYQDAFSVGMHRRAERSTWMLRWLFRLETKRLQRLEAQAFQQFEHCLIISEQDRAGLSFAQKEQVKIVPNGVDLNFFQPNPALPKAYDLVFVGNMGYFPNVEAAKFLVQEVLPLVRAKRPEIKVLIAGARPTAEVKNLAGNNVFISGWLGNILTAYHSAKLFIAPLFLGSGQQNKILEAMACGLPCITTPQVNNAIGARVNETIFIAETAETFASTVLKLLADPILLEQTGALARQFVESHFSWQSATAELERLFEK